MANSWPRTAEIYCKSENQSSILMFITCSVALRVLEICTGVLLRLLVGIYLCFFVCLSLHGADIKIRMRNQYKDQNEESTSPLE